MLSRRITKKMCLWYLLRMVSFKHVIFICSSAITCYAQQSDAAVECGRWRRGVHQRPQWWYNGETRCRKRAACATTTASAHQHKNYATGNNHLPLPGTKQHTQAGDLWTFINKILVWWLLAEAFIYYLKTSLIAILGKWSRRPLNANKVRTLCTIFL